MKTMKVMTVKATSHLGTLGLNIVTKCVRYNYDKELVV